MLLLVVLAAAPAQAGATDKWFGFNDNSTLASVLEPAQDARLLARAGANSARIQVEWSFVQPGPRKLDLSLYDPIYKAWTDAGIRPLLIVTGAPRWAWTRWTWCPRDRTCHIAPDRTKDREWSQFVAAVVRRYPLAVAIEVWNEPNLAGFWLPGPDPGRYTELLRLARDAVKAVDPSMPVLGGSLAPILNDAQDGPAYGVGPFLRKMYADGARSLMDGLAFHIYPQGQPARAAQTLAAVRALSDGLPLWVTEFGASTTAGYSDQAQAATLSAGVSRLLAQPDVAGVYVHMLIDPPRPNPSNPEHGYGVLRAPDDPKPAFFALRAAVAR